MKLATDPTHEETAGAVGAATGGQTPQEGIEMNESRVPHPIDLDEATWARVIAARPSWADPSVTFFDDDLVLFRRTVNSVTICQDFVIDGLDVTAAGQVYVSIDSIASDVNVLPAAKLYETATDIFAAWLATSGITSASATTAGVADATPAPDRRSVPRSSAGDQDERQVEWLTNNAVLVATVQPAWADGDLTEVDFEYPEDAESKAEAVMFIRRAGTVAIEQAFLFEDEKRLYAPSHPQVWTEEDGRAIEIDRAAAVGVDLLRATQMHDGAGSLPVGLFEVMGNELGFSGTDLFALAHVEKHPEDVVTVGELHRVGQYIGMSPADMVVRARATETARCGDCDVVVGAIPVHVCSDTQVTPMPAEVSK